MTKKYKVSDLSDTLLDNAVAKIQLMRRGITEQSWLSEYHKRWKDGEFRPSEIAAQAWLIIENERIGIKPLETLWEASSQLETSTGETSLIAAMRCFVKTYSGEDVYL